MTAEQSIDMLASQYCRCGKNKERKHAFCGPCYMKLPMALNKSIYQPVGQGFEDSYLAACEYLDKQTEIEIARNPQANLF